MKIARKERGEGRGRERAGRREGRGCEGVLQKRRTRALVLTGGLGAAPGGVL